MCLAVPLQISSIIDGETAMVRQGRTEMSINTSLLDNPQEGDFVIVHAGFGIELVDLEDANERIRLIKEMQESADS